MSVVDISDLRRESPLLQVKITHRQFGPLSWREWLLFMRVHDLDHMRQLQAISRHFAA